MKFALSPEDIDRCHSISFGNRDLIMDIVKAVAEQTEIPVAALIGERRTRAISHARWLICYLAHEKGHTVQAIGRVLRKDHSSVLYGITQEKLRRGEKRTPSE